MPIAHGGEADAAAVADAMEFIARVERSHALGSDERESERTQLELHRAIVFRLLALEGLRQARREVLRVDRQVRLLRSRALQSGVVISLAEFYELFSRHPLAEAPTETADRWLGALEVVLQRVKQHVSSETNVADIMLGAWAFEEMRRAISGQEELAEGDDGGVDR